MVASGRSLSDGDAGDGEKKNTMRALPILRPRQCSQDERDDWNDTFHNAVDRVPMIKAAFRYAMPSKSEIADKLKDSTPSEIEGYYTLAIAEYEMAQKTMFYTVYDSLDLTGPFKTIDRQHIRSHFRNDDDDTCDGKGLHGWVASKPRLRHGGPQSPRPHRRRYCHDLPTSSSASGPRRLPRTPPSRSPTYLLLRKPPYLDYRVSLVRGALVSAL